jgi:hypothetical protein
MKSYNCFVCCVIAFSLFGCVKKVEFSTSKPSEVIVISNQLKQISLELRKEMGDRDHLPFSFAELDSPSVNSNLFLYAISGKSPGKMKDVEDWTDFIYIGNCAEDVPDAALIISPPENHGGKTGHLLTVDGTFMTLPAGLVRQVIQEPWILATNTPQQNIEHLKGEIIVRVPRRFSDLYSNTQKR